ncbi:hypothetical protein DH2020_007992 [Rehmannia glutinosa]|uniref:Uncharacterized protein n=1 Tax=Rehmannia glutinosa TaxID=99300 RepID=A0ABR0TZR7_REHGL
MSRCFPYPLPGYTLSRARNEALIESIKNLDKPDIVKGHIGQKDCSDTKDEFLHKGMEAETEQLERSSLTEEHARPVSLSLPSTSFDSTENSKKRKRHSSTIDDNHKHGKVTLIGLSLKKQNEFDASAKEQNLCSISGQSDIGRGFTVRNNMEQICSTSGHIEGKTGIKYMPDAVLSSKQRVELEYENLLENYFPPQIQDACFYTDDLDWLFQDRNQDDKKIRAEKRRRCASDSFYCSRSSGLWPLAEYLHEIDTYALPFTVPY